jgi:hypothetical protein
MKSREQLHNFTPRPSTPVQGARTAAFCAAASLSRTGERARHPRPAPFHTPSWAFFPNNDPLPILLPSALLSPIPRPTKGPERPGFSPAPHFLENRPASRLAGPIPAPRCEATTATNRPPPQHTPHASSGKKSLTFLAPWRILITRGSFGLCPGNKLKGVQP